MATLTPPRPDTTLFTLPTTAPAPRPHLLANVPPRTAYDDVDRCTYLGSHMPPWLEHEEIARRRIPLCVSYRRLARRRTLPRARVPWMLDSGGFSELSLYGEWRTDPRTYAAAVRRFAEEIGQLDHAAIQDWMTEDEFLTATGLRQTHHLLYSSDSLAWSYGARHNDPLPGCAHTKCSNCLRYALAWRDRLLNGLPERKVFPKLTLCSERGRPLTG